MVIVRTLRWPGAILMLVLAAGCGEEPGPTAPSSPSAEPAPPAVQEPVSGLIFSEKAVGISPTEYGILSDPTDRATGTYRFQRLSGSAPDVTVDDIIVGRGEDRFLRRVVSVAGSDDVLTLETVPAYWPEVIPGGRYEISVPLVPSARPDGPLRASASAGPSVGFGGAVEWVVANLDLCAEMEGLCNVPVGETCKEFGSRTKVEVCGELTKLEVVEGRVGFGGTLEGVLEVREPSYDAGRAAVFAPCNQVPYAVGCGPLTQTLDGFFELIGLEPPDPLLPVPNSVCIPGTLIWTSWDDYEICRITDLGRAPQLQLGGLEEAGFVTSAQLGGEFVLDVAGNGSVTVKIPVAGAVADTVGTDSTNVKFNYSVGSFVVMKVDLSGAGATIRFGMEEGVRVTQGWSPQTGWGRAIDEIIEIAPHDFSGQIEPRAADSVATRSAFQLEVEMELCLTLFEGGCVPDDDAASADLFDLVVDAAAGATVARFMSGTYKRNEQGFDNWHINIDGAYDVVVKADLDLTLPFEEVFESIAIDKQTLDTTLECCRMDLADLYGTGRLEVETATTGDDMDEDGYTALVYIADTIRPRLLAAGAEPVGRQSYLDTLALAAPTNGMVAFEPSVLPCSVLYTDIALFAFPVASLVTSAARRLGFLAPPNYGAALFCDMVIADYWVTLVGVAENCEVTSAPNPKLVTLQQENLTLSRSNTVREMFDIECSPLNQALGTLEVEVDTRSLGNDEDIDPNGYNVLVDDELRGVVGPNGTLRITGLMPALGRRVRLAGVSANCDASDPVSADVVSGEVTAVGPLEVTCGPPGTRFGDLRVLTETTGADLDQDGYALFVDGAERAAIDPNGESLTSGIQVGRQIVVYLDGVEENCAVNGPNPRITRIDIETNAFDEEILSTQTTFDVTCWPLATVVEIHEGKVTLRGSAPVLTVTLEVSGGMSVPLLGPLVPELQQLDGATVAVRGMMDASGLHAVSYEIVSSDGSGRFFGFLVQRGVEGGQPPVFRPCHESTEQTPVVPPCQHRAPPAPDSIPLVTFNAFYSANGIPIRDNVPPPPDGVCVPGDVHQVGSELKTCQVIDLGLPPIPEMWLVAGTEIQLVDVPEAMWDAAGALVWVAGEVIEGRLRPEVFGVIRALTP